MKTKIFSTLALLACLVISCSDDDDAPYTCSTCVDTPEAVAANDNSGKGIYKGLFIGSSGTIKFDIANNGNSIVAILMLDGENITLQTTGTYNADTGLEAYFTNSSKGISIGFYVSANGGSVEVFDIVIPGHPNAEIEIAKELSSSLIRVFEGRFSGGANGTFNMFTKEDEWIIVAREDGKTNSTKFYGILSNEALQCVTCPVTITGKIQGDNSSGDWQSPSDGKTGKWSGKRTL